MNYVLSIAKEYKYELLLIYFYMFVAQLSFLLQPYVLGRMILIFASTLQGKNWTSLNITKVTFLIAAIVIFTRTGDISQGDAVAMYNILCLYQSILGITYVNSCEF